MKRILQLILLMWPLFSLGQSEVHYLEIQSGELSYIGESAGFWCDTSNDASFESAILQTYESSSNKVLNFNRNPHPYWIKIPIQNLGDDTNFFLQLEYPMIDSIEVYEGDLRVPIFKTGDRYKYDSRPFDHPTFLFPFTLPKGEKKILYVRVRSSDQLFLPLRIGNARSISEDNGEKLIFLGVYFGVVFAMFFYNLFLFITTRDNSYLWYILYILAIGMTQWTLEGLTFKFFFPNSPEFYNASTVLFSALTGLAAIEFAKIFVQPKRFTPRLYKGLFIFQAVYILAVVAYLLGFVMLSYTLVDMAALTVSIYAVVFVSIIARKGYRPAMFFLIAWTVFLIGLFIFALRNFGYIEYSFVTKSILEIGSGLELILLSMALADRINSLKKEKEASQEAALLATQENVRIVREQNEILESKVKERTEELEKTLYDLKEAQSQLVDAEKMASLGQLTAGIAHEINNPINFISANMAPLKRDIDEVKEYLAWLEEKVKECDSSNSLEELERFKEEIDFDYTLEEIDHLLQGVKDGTERTVEIIKGLKIFSRVDEQDIKYVNLHDGLDSTLILLNNGIKDIIQLNRHYAELPKIECYAGKLNQVFMNILNNASQAIRSNPNQKEKGCIDIYTERISDQWIQVRIEDNGPGMPEEVRKKIFEPFYTTKPVGEGTGLGLSIVYNIIKNHSGTIEVNSELGKGTTFIITLPIRHPQEY